MSSPVGGSPPTSSPADSAALESLRGEIGLLARIADDQLDRERLAGSAAQSDVVIAVGDLVAVLPMAGLVDLDAERARIEKELANAQRRDRAIDPAALQPELRRARAGEAGRRPTRPAGPGRRTARRPDPPTGRSQRR